MVFYWIFQDLDTIDTINIAKANNEELKTLLQNSDDNQMQLAAKINNMFSHNDTKKIVEVAHNLKFKILEELLNDDEINDIKYRQLEKGLMQYSKTQTLNLAAEGPVGYERILINLAFIVNVLFSVLHKNNTNQDISSEEQRIHFLSRKIYKNIFNRLDDDIEEEFDKLSELQKSELKKNAIMMGSSLSMFISMPLLMEIHDNLLEKDIDLTFLETINNIFAQLMIKPHADIRRISNNVMKNQLFAASEYQDNILNNLEEHGEDGASILTNIRVLFDSQEEANNPANKVIDAIIQTTNDYDDSWTVTMGRITVKLGEDGPVDSGGPGRLVIYNSINNLDSTNYVVNLSAESQESKNFIMSFAHNQPVENARQKAVARLIYFSIIKFNGILDVFATSMILMILGIQPSISDIIKDLNKNQEYANILQKWKDSSFCVDDMKQASQDLIRNSYPNLSDVQELADAKLSNLLTLLGSPTLQELETLIGIDLRNKIYQNYIDKSQPWISEFQKCKSNLKMALSDTPIILPDWQNYQSIVLPESCSRSHFNNVIEARINDTHSNEEKNMLHNLQQIINANGNPMLNVTMLNSSETQEEEITFLTFLSLQISSCKMLPKIRVNGRCYSKKEFHRTSPAFSEPCFFRTILNDIDEGLYKQHMTYIPVFEAHDCFCELIMLKSNTLFQFQISFLECVRELKYFPIYYQEGV